MNAKSQFNGSISQNVTFNKWKTSLKTWTEKIEKIERKKNWIKMFWFDWNALKLIDFWFLLSNSIGLYGFYEFDYFKWSH